MPNFSSLPYYTLRKSNKQVSFKQNINFTKLLFPISWILHIIPACFKIKFMKNNL